MYDNCFPFSAVLGQNRIKTALILNLINPHIGGVLISGEKGTAKSTMVRGLSKVVDYIDVVDLPLNITEDRLIGSIDINKAVRFGEKKLEEAKETLKKAEEHLKEGHKGHFDLVQKEARGEKLEFSILFMHAEDQLLTTATLKDVVTEMINMYTMIHEK